MDPQQRLLLEVTYEGLENGRSLDQIMVSKLMVDSWNSFDQNYGHKDILLCGIFLCRLYGSLASGSRVCTDVSVHKLGTISRNDGKQTVILL